VLAEQPRLPAVPAWGYSTTSTGTGTTSGGTAVGYSIGGTTTSTGTGVTYGSGTGTTANSGTTGVSYASGTIEQQLQAIKAQINSLSTSVYSFAAN